MRKDETTVGPRWASNPGTNQQEAQGAEVEGSLALLTPRERQVLELILAGKRTKQIAAELGLSARTIEVYRAHLKMKLRTGSLVELVRVAIRNGLVDA